MNASHVNSQKKLSHVLSIRLTDQELKHLKETLKNYGIHRGCLSSDLRALLDGDVYRSRRYRKAWMK
jgi:hypothetical protein